MDAHEARHLWLVGEPIHALTYFSPDAAAAWDAAGVRGFWHGCFATRATPFGAVGPEVVTASFYNFHPGMVAKAVPAVWSMISPAAAIEARLAGMDAAFRATVGDDLLTDAAVGAAVAILRRVVAAASVEGRALFAANAALPWPSPRHLELWHALTCLREHRGDGHNAALLAAGLDGCQAHVLAAAAGGSPREVTQPTRGWSDDDWDVATADLVDRGVLAADGTITGTGRELHAAVESTTDAQAAAPWSSVSESDAAAVVAALTPWARIIQASGQIRQPNPMGLPPLP